MNKIEGWSRRRFLQRSGALVLVASLPVWFRCAIRPGHRPWSKEQRDALAVVMDIILPADEHGPGALEVGALEFIEWTLKDPFYDEDIQRFVLEGIDSLNRKSHRQYGRSFAELKVEIQYQMIEAMARRGDAWLSRMITLALEALLVDPVYGANRDAQGWKWLGHYVGHPRPDVATRYEALMQRRYEASI